MHPEQRGRNTFHQTIEIGFQYTELQQQELHCALIPSRMHLLRVQLEEHLVKCLHRFLEYSSSLLTFELSIKVVNVPTRVEAFRVMR